MKKPLNTSGVTQVQAVLLTLTDHELRLQTAAIRQNFTQWMEDHFDLTSSQIAYLMIMPSGFHTYLANCIADTLDRREMVFFAEQFSEERPVHNPTFKGVLINRSENCRWLKGHVDAIADETLSIQITYG